MSDELTVRRRAKCSGDADVWEAEQRANPLLAAAGAKLKARVPELRPQRQALVEFLVASVALQNELPGVRRELTTWEFVEIIGGTFGFSEQQVRDMLADLMVQSFNGGDKTT